MAIDEDARYRLHGKLERILGAQDAGALMSSLPPFSWDQMVTRDYLDLRLESVKNELQATFRLEFATQTRTIILSLIGTLIAFAGVVLASIRIA